MLKMSSDFKACLVWSCELFAIENLAGFTAAFLSKCFKNEQRKVKLKVRHIAYHQEPAEKKKVVVDILQTFQ